VAEFIDDVLMRAGSENAKLKRDTRVEIVALHIYEVAYRTMEVVTRRMVDRELERLRATNRAVGATSRAGWPGR